MIRRIKRACNSLKTREKVTEIFDGTDRLCADRFGFKTAGGRTFSHLAVKVFSPSPNLANAAYAYGMPAIDSGILMTRFGQIYKWNFAEGTIKNSGTVNNVKSFVVECSADGENAYTVFGGNKLCVMKKDSQAVSAIPYKLYCGAFHYGRTFARDFNDPYLIRWSNYGTYDWAQGLDKGGFVRLNSLGGEVVGIVSYGEKLVIVRKFAVCVMRALGDARHFSIEQSEVYAVPAVTPFTSVICGGQLWFYTADGLYSFNGNSVSRKPFPDRDRGYQAEHATPFAGRYIYFNLTKGSEKCLMEYDTQEDSFTRFADGGYLAFKRGDKLYCFSGISVRELSAEDGSADYFWKSVGIDLGTDKCKTLKNLIAEGDGDLAFEIDCDGRKREAGGFGITRIGERGRTFTFTVRGNGSLKRLSAEWEVNS